MRASVVVVTFNHRHVVPACLDAVRSSIGAEDEVVVVDNASTDGTPEVLAQRYPWVHLVRSTRNTGYGAANNLAASQSQARFLVFLNPDAIPQPGWLEALLAPLTDEAALVTAKLLLARTPERVDAVGHDVHISGIATCRGWGEPAVSYTHVEEVAAVSGACFGVPRDLFHRLGGFDARMFLYYEDDDLSLRARLAGSRCLVAPEARVLHDHTPGFSASKVRFLHRNRWWTLLKVLNPRTLLALAPVLLGGEVLAWGLALRGGPAHVSSTLAAYADLVRWLPSLPQARAAVQRQRAVSDAQLLAGHGSGVRIAQVSSAAWTTPAERMLGSFFGGGRRLAALLGVR